MRFVKCITPTNATRALMLSDDEIIEILTWLDVISGISPKRNENR